MLEFCVLVLELLLLSAPMMKWLKLHPIHYLLGPLLLFSLVLLINFDLRIDDLGSGL